MATRKIGFVAAAVLGAASIPALAQSGTMNMPMAEKPAHFAPTRQAYTTNRRFLVRLLSVPQPIPFEKYFKLRLAVYDPKHPAKPLPDARLALSAGMRHGLKHGFAHGMQSAPKIAEKDGIFTVSGMYFHMMGPWTLKAAVARGGGQGTAYFQLPCCGR
jgi:hypothetical protein